MKAQAESDVVARIEEAKQRHARARHRRAEVVQEAYVRGIGEFGLPRSGFSWTSYEEHRNRLREALPSKEAPRGAKRHGQLDHKVPPALRLIQRALPADSTYRKRPILPEKVGHISPEAFAEILLCLRQRGALGREDLQSLIMDYTAAEHEVTEARSALAFVQLHDWANRDEADCWIPGFFCLEDAHWDLDYPGGCTANILLRLPEGQDCFQFARGEGPIEAVCLAMQKMLGPLGVTFNLREIDGKEAGAEGAVSATIHVDGQAFEGRWRDKNTIAAAARAVVEALNQRIMATRPARSP